jgi:hypothetical protein
LKKKSKRESCREATKYLPLKKEEAAKLPEGFYLEKIPLALRASPLQGEIMVASQPRLTN